MRETTMKAKETRDFGQKIGGARKDFYRKALSLDDLSSMNSAEVTKLVKKENIWPKQDPVKLVGSGIPQAVVYWQNEVKKTLPATVKDRNPENYITVLSGIRDYVERVTNRAGVDGFMAFLKDRYTVEKTHASRYIRPTEEAYGILNNKLLRVASKPYAIFEKEARQKLYGIAKEAQPEVKLRQDIVIREIGENLFMKDDYTGRKIVSMQISNGWMYFYPKEGSKMADEATWVNGNFAVLNTCSREILSNSEISEEKAKEFVENYIKEKLEQVNENPTAATKSGKSRKKKFAIPELENIVRTGPTYHDGNITGEDILSFGIRGGEFGNWLNDADAKASMAESYDAFMDLARILNIEKTDISHNGTLAIAYGARGKGGMNAAVAHFEPVRCVINITKHHPGSLAHEWAHALDNYIGKMSGVSFTEYGTMASKAARGERKLLPMSYLELVDAMNWKMVKPDEEKWRKAHEEKISRWRKLFDMAVAAIAPANLSDEDQAEWDSVVEKVWKSRMEANSLDYSNFPGMTNFKNKEIEKLSATRKKFARYSLDKRTKEKISTPLVQAKLVETEMRKGLDELVRVKSDFKTGSECFDRLYSKHSNGYLVSETEMFARAFDCYVAHKLRQEGNVSQYLTAHADCYHVSREGETIYAVPTGAERVEIFEKIDALLQDLKERGWLHEAAKETK